MRTTRHLIFTVIACITLLAYAQTADAQYSSAQMSSNPYQQLDDLARNANGSAGVDLLYKHITASTLFGPYPDSISSRLYRTTMAHSGTVPSRITEKSIADAVNYLGRYLAGNTFTGTNELQVHLLRVGMYGNLPHLLQSPTPPPPHQLVGREMTPAGGAYMALLVLRQKLTNPAWYGDPDTQNQKVLSYVPKPQAQPLSSRGVTQEPALAANVRRKLARDLKSDNNATIAAFHRFLDIAGFDQ